MISIAQPIIEDEERAAVSAVLKSGMLAQGPKVIELEEEFAKYCGTKHAVAVNSGTAAIHAALFAAGVGEGDEVITVPFSFIATINPIIMLGAKPVLVDIDPETYNIDVSQIENAITNKTKAILPVHLYGQPADMDELNAIAKKHNLVVVEDACQAIGAEYKGKRAGSLGDLGCFSLYATKNIMCGEGGVITTDDAKFALKMKQFRQHGMSGPYQYEGLGYNYRLTDLQAAIAIEQLKKADVFNEKRKKNAEALSDKLKTTTAVLPVKSAGRSHVYHQYTISVAKGRDELVKKLKDHEIIAGIYYPKPLHLVPHISKYGYKEGDFPVTEQASKQVLSLPVHPKLSKVDLLKITATVRELLDA